ncbi:type II toxin-antitoxin system CcdA family antitoxin [Streptomyces sp. GQFP]|uniref:type II toxin-antitoxin system CcdA family antitoxin n=1 Tax=Streptomyces sp. GQFP TaxID=2907545 RepID=UPI001F42D34D|nr:type II toxin-antitoxin system CcdA family antitoxin [Streptomyces sp. GQFP]UIX32986.1 type II toxin-antitoxin system CcdA family antitoxin [Streptomyces sp. GQFP]
MTTKERVTVTLSPDVLATAREAADGNLSARVERALLMQQLMDDAQKLAAWQRETGEERAEVLEAAALDTFGGGQ